MRHDILSDVLSAIKKCDEVGKTEIITPASKMVKDVLLVLQKNKFIGEFEFIDDGRGGKFRINLLGSINNCGAVRPRFSVRVDEYERYERRFLPAVNFGFLIVSTSQGIMIHHEAKEKKIGGKLLAFIY